MHYSKTVLFVLFFLVMTNAHSWAKESATASGSDFRIGIGVSLDLGSASQSQESQIANPNSNSFGPPIGVPLLYPAVHSRFPSRCDSGIS